MKKKRKNYGHKSQCDDWRGRKWREVEKGIRRINGDGRRLDFRW